MPTARLFFALWPDAAVRDELLRAARMLHSSCGGRAMRGDDLHLTLVFLGDVLREKIPQLAAIAAAQRMPAFALEFGAVRYWQHNRILWAAPHAVPPPLFDFVVALESALEEAEFDFDRRPYVPHVTLLRGSRPAARPPPFACTWPVRDFALVEAVRDPSGVSYRTLERWDARNQ